jgi:NAD(P)-dependent dehydrogenase (short-subunit alcohol dehydrogenase family)
MKNAAAGKTVLVTGSGSGIGRAIAESFAVAGASELILVARRKEPLEQTGKIINDCAPNCKVSVFGGVDIADFGLVKNMFDALTESPDIVVSNAAVSMATATIADSDPSTWFKEIDINIKGAYTVAHLYVNAARAANKEGCLINVSSNASWRYVPGRSSYATSKVSMNSMSEYIHREEEASGGRVRCVAMHPGGVLTDLASAGDLPEAIKKILIDTPALPGGVAVYLSTDRARFLMSRFVVATWDLEQLENERERIEKEDLLKTRVLGVM